MNVSAPWQKAILFGVLLFLCFASPGMVLSQQQHSNEHAIAGPCAAPEYHQFDFWVGDWDVYDIETKSKDAHVTVDRILDGCVLREQYDGADGHRGQSFSIYDASRKVWHQSWVTNRGQLLLIEGGLRGKDMVLSGSDQKGGEKELVRGEWKPVKEGVRETAVISTDGGKTWKPWFDLLFRPAETGGASDPHR